MNKERLLAAFPFFFIRSLPYKKYAVLINTDFMKKDRLPVRNHHHLHHLIQDR